MEVLTLVFRFLHILGLAVLIGGAAAKLMRPEGSFRRLILGGALAQVLTGPATYVRRVIITVVGIEFLPLVDEPAVPYGRMSFGFQMRHEASAKRRNQGFVAGEIPGFARILVQVEEQLCAVFLEVEVLVGSFEPGVLSVDLHVQSLSTLRSCFVGLAGVQTGEKAAAADVGR